MTVEVRYLTYKQVDKIKWDQCVATATNGLVYAYSFYLDAMAKHWDALVLNDYQAVMPLTWNKKYGLYYLYQPPFTAQLGVFGNELTAELVKEFLNAIPKKFRYWDINCNRGNYFKLQGFDLHERMNYVLPLSGNYATIFNSYKNNIQRNIKKAGQLGCVIKKDIAISDVIALSAEQVNAFVKISTQDFERLKSLYLLLKDKQQAVTYGIYNNEMLVASAAFFFSHKRAYYILVGNHPNGKTIGASHALIDAFIKDHAANDLLLDFEGSDIHSLAFFYSSFGAVPEKYPALRLNRLPLFLQWLKK